MFREMLRTLDQAANQGVAALKALPPAIKAGLNAQPPLEQPLVEPPRPDFDYLHNVPPAPGTRPQP